MTRFGLFLIWLLHWLPLSLLAALGRCTGALLYMVAGERRRVVLTNLRLCFPSLNDTERRAIAREHFAVFTRSLLEHGILWWGSRERVLKLVRIEGLEHWQAVRDRPVIWLAPHFVGLDMGGIRLTAEFPLVSVYSRQKNPVFDRILLHGRTRLGPTELYSRQDGIRGVAKAIKKGLPFYYLPDMDFGERDSIFVPFFGVHAATITGLARIAALTGAVVVPVVTTQLPGGDGYVLRFHPAWEHYPSGDLAADTRRMNAFIEEQVRGMPAQYYWLHKRFKTRPPGEARIY
ncbi:MAG: lipid A biosynthesis acyltransferase [Betaproteobacteria bacterium]|nr:lipid A biosynthesis acyltransferase [Betaproteobacteria bacterium]